ncbi:hypothetical protein GDO81_006202 [Engystomops pustulosus]|uniref:Uncharacterized protein n=1 Tax=Engystomops pustulosus TaxID=76066 RepID=A0AAV7CWQ7_ENGPU|nr:hypothetical protein GDO81_006202 [Engystomops pustulosus]
MSVESEPVHFIRTLTPKNCQRLRFHDYKSPALVTPADPCSDFAGCNTVKEHISPTPSALPPVPATISWKE